MPEAKLVPIYTTSGDVGALLAYPYIYNLAGEWIGWVASNRLVYSVLGYHIGQLTNEPRILRRRSHDYTQPRRKPPAPPPAIRLPSSQPLPPMFPELALGFFDVLDEEPELLPPVDSGELREDLD